MKVDMSPQAVTARLKLLDRRSHCRTADRDLDRHAMLDDRAEVVVELLHGVDPGRVGRDVDVEDRGFRLLELAA